MPLSNLNRFFISIVVPSILAIGLFILSIFVVILPAFERNIMEGKKEMISELTNTVCSLIEEYHQEAEEQFFSRDSAQAQAVERIRQIRYGDELKDYFWIIDKQPEMIMHPYRIDLIGKGLNDYKDPNGKLLFVEAVSTVVESGEGFIDYMWQWKDDSTRIVPKLSYVKEFQPWNWIVGTGIYLEDVSMEIRALKKRLLRVVLLISAIISVILTYIIRQSLIIEQKRKKAERALNRSREKYKSLVEASTEGTLMMVNGVFIFSNMKFSDLSGYDPMKVRELKFEELFTLKWNSIEQEFKDPKRSVSREASLICEDGTCKVVVVSVSRITHAEQTGHIIVIKEVSPKMQVEKEHLMLSSELQTVLSMMNQPLRSYAQEIRRCPADATIREAAVLMSRKQKEILFIQQGDEIIGVINGSDLNRRVLATGINPDQKVLEIMTSPVVTLPEDALLFEGLLLMKEKKVSHVGLRRPDNTISGVVGYREIDTINSQSIAFLIMEIEASEEVEQLIQHYRRLQVLVKALLESGSHTANVTRVITSVADAIHRRLITLSMEELGPPPCRFAFMVLGSLGREEQTLATDQDNAILLEDHPAADKKKVKTYFLALGKRVNQDLARIGYMECPGEIMAGNPQWNQPLDTWKGYFNNWIRDCDPQDILDAAIFFDFRCLFGEASLVDSLRAHVNLTAQSKAVFFYHMAQSIMKMKPPLNFFGNIRSDSNAGELILDLKKVLLPVTSYLRLYAIREGLDATGSIRRNEQLRELKVFESSVYEELKHTFNYLTGLRIRSQSSSIFHNEIPGNTINFHQLSRIEIAALKKLFSYIGSLQTRLGSAFDPQQL